MTVYVDNMQAQLGRMKMCHMIADTEEELFRMADKIGVARKHYQDKRSGKHFDICLSKRRLAVANGATEVTLRELATMNMRRKMTGELGMSSNALSWFKNRGAA